MQMCRKSWDGCCLERSSNLPVDPALNRRTGSRKHEPERNFALNKLFFFPNKSDRSTCLSGVDSASLQGNKHERGSGDRTGHEPAGRSFQINNHELPGLCFFLDDRDHRALGHVADNTHC